MTVQELIAALEKMPQDADVKSETDVGDCDVTEVLLDAAGDVIIVIDC